MLKVADAISAFGEIPNLFAMRSIALITHYALRITHYLAAFIGAMKQR